MDGIELVINLKVVESLWCEKFVSNRFEIIVISPMEQIQIIVLHSFYLSEKRDWVELL